MSLVSLLSELEEMPAFLRESMAGLPRECLLRGPGNDSSPLLEHLWHVRDCDSDLYGARIRRVLGQDKPKLEPVDVGRWPADRAYLERDAEPAMREFARLRAELVMTLRDLDPDALARTGIRADGSEINVRELVEQLAEHDRDHRRRISAILRNDLGHPDERP